MPAFPPHYRPFRAFVAPAKGTAELWRTVAGLIVMFVFAAYAMRFVSSLILSVMGPVGGTLTLVNMARGLTPLGMIEGQLANLPMAAGLLLATALLMNRGPASLIGPLAQATWCFVWVAVPIIALALALLPMQIAAPNIGKNLEPLTLLQWLPLALPGLLLQTGTEELLFRGYLQQQLAARWSSPWVWLAVPSAAFGMAHWAPAQYGDLAPLVVLWGFSFGLAAADLTARTGNIGAALGLHFAFNAQSLFLVGQYGYLHGLSLYVIQLPPGDGVSELPYLAVDFLMLLVGWLSARVILRV